MSQSGALSCSIGCTQLLNRVHSIAQSAALSCSIGCTHLTNRVHSLDQSGALTRQLASAKERRSWHPKKVFAFFFMIFSSAVRLFSHSHGFPSTRPMPVSVPKAPNSTDTHSSLSASPSAPSSVPSPPSASVHTIAWWQAHPSLRKTFSCFSYAQKNFSVLFIYTKSPRCYYPKHT